MMTQPVLASILRNVLLRGAVSCEPVDEAQGSPLRFINGFSLCSTERAKESPAFKRGEELAHSSQDTHLTFSVKHCTLVL